MDPNNKQADFSYDPLGRRTQIWQTDHKKATYPTQPNTQYSYLVRANAPSVVTTQSLLDNGTYLTSNSLYDGFLRTRQAQTPSTAGRLISDTRYDSRGLTIATKTYADSNPVDTTLASTTDNLISDQSTTTYDTLERPTINAVLVYGQEKWHTTTAYDGDRVTVTPPDGGTPTTTISDAQGRATELRQFHTATATGAYDSTVYTYDPRGGLATVKDPAGNTWRYGYDLRGRQATITDPDAGTIHTTYDDLDRPVTTTDARGKILATVYDALGRKTELRDDSATGTLRASWAYDTIAKGQPTSSTRYDNGHAYTTTVTGYDNAYRTLGTTTTIPDNEGALAGSYTFKNSYTGTGRLNSQTYPKTADLPAESVITTYNSLGQPNTLTAGGNPYVSTTSYSDFGETQKVSLASASVSVDHSYFYEIGTHRLNRTRVASLQASGGPLLEDKTYDYNNAGGITKIADTAASDPDTQCFTYDYLQRLTEAWTPSDSDCTSNPGQRTPWWRGAVLAVLRLRPDRQPHHQNRPRCPRAPNRAHRAI